VWQAASHGKASDMSKYNITFQHTGNPGVIYGIMDYYASIETMDAVAAAAALNSSDMDTAWLVLCGESVLRAVHTRYLRCKPVALSLPQRDASEADALVSLCRGSCLLYAGRVRDA